VAAAVVVVVRVIELVVLLAVASVRVRPADLKDK
jgi:hypothetical protein